MFNYIHTYILYTYIYIYILSSGCDSCLRPGFQPSYAFLSCNLKPVLTEGGGFPRLFICIP